MTYRHVADGYAHTPKTAEPGGVLDLPGGGFLKWYGLRPAAALITAEDAAAARDHVRATAAEGWLDGDRGFAIHHRCGDAYLLLLCTWRENNELWQTVYENASGAYRLLGRADPHLPTNCVWELGVVASEALAWSTYLASARTAADERAYLDHRFAGRV